MDQLVLTVLPDSSAEWMAVRAPLIFLTESIAIIFSLLPLKTFLSITKISGTENRENTPTEFEQKWRLSV